MKTLWKDYIPNDYTRCWNKLCPLRNDCLRFLDKGKGTVTISDFKPTKGKCEHQIITDIIKTDKKRIMEKLQQLLEVFRKFEDIIHKTEFKQYTIDFIQDSEVDTNYLIDADPSESEVETHIGAIQYDISCTLDIIKEGKDKELFQQLEKAIESF